MDFTIHYYRYQEDYEGWGLHLWNAVEEESGTFTINGEEYDWNNAFPWQGEDEYGVYWTFDLDDSQELGFIVHKGDEKDPPGLDRYFDDYDTSQEIWLLQGVADIYTEEPSTAIRMKSAYGDGLQTITVIMTGLIENAQNRFAIYKNGYPDGQEISIDSVSVEESNVYMNLSEEIDITKLYEVYDTELEEKKAVIHNFPEDEYVYTGDDLGFNYSPQSTTFKLWSPSATNVDLHIYSSTNVDDYDSYTMERQENGVLEVTVEEDLKNKYYLYEIAMMGETYTTPDPWSLGLSTNSEYSLIYDIDDTEPEGWENDSWISHEAKEDVIIYELHIRDVSIDETWEGSDNKQGKYLGLVEPGTTYEGLPSGFDHIVDLGVNAVQIMPMYDFSSVDETDPNDRNWGYDPYAYNSPEGSYASNPNDISRIVELKSMVKEFHDAGIKVIMDVVYNHTYATGRGSLFDNIAPKYFYRLDDSGEYLNWSGCGNVVDTEKPMAREFIKQSVKHWVEDYHIDGFRFDLMGLIDTDLMEEIVDTLETTNPHIMVYGEPWGGWGAPILTGKGDQRNLDFGCFNDNIRNAIRGDTDGLTPGYAMGAIGNWNTLKKGVMGSINDFTADPSETINYVSAHDNYTWWDKLERTVTNMPDDALIEMSKLGNAIVLTSQGVPFLHAGVDFIRTKRVPGVPEEQIRNSYNANDEVNKLDWERMAEYYDVVNYYKGLIELRKARKEFRLETAEEIEDNLEFYPNDMNGVMLYKISDVTPEDNWGDILVCYNPNSSKANITLPSGDWVVVVDEDEAGVDPVETGTSIYTGTNHFSSKFSIEPFSAMVMYKKPEDNIVLNVFQNPAVDSYINFTINSDEILDDLSLKINDEEVEIDSIAVGCWHGSYHLEESGDYVFSLNTGDRVVKRFFSVGKIGASYEIIESADRNVSLEIQANSLSRELFFVLLDSELNENLQDGEYFIGNRDITLNKEYKIRFKTNKENQSIFYYNAGWVELETKQENGSVFATFNKLGKFKIDKAQSLSNFSMTMGNYPNPFNLKLNNHTEIFFEVTQNVKKAKIEIFNIKGRKIKDYKISDVIKNKKYSVKWDGKNNFEKEISSGIYFYRISTPRKEITNKILLLK